MSKKTKIVKPINNHIVVVDDKPELKIVITEEETPIVTVKKGSIPDIINRIQSRNLIRVTTTSTGPRGVKGDDGRSAYDLWLIMNPNGTFEEFLNSGGYIHPNFHPATMIVEDYNRRFMSTDEKAKALETFIFDQQIASAEWLIPHDLDKYPAVTITDTGGNTVIGNVTYITKGLLTISFNYEFSGKAYLN